MRNGAPSWLLVWSLAITLSTPLIAVEHALVGKTAAWEIWGTLPPKVRPSLTEGESLETPNQRRKRLGLPIEASYPPAEAGVAEETPNQLRRRLALESSWKLGLVQAESKIHDREGP